MVRRALPLMGLVVLVLCPVALADTGHVQILAGPGISVVLDGEPKGVTTEASGGMILADLPVGEHRICLFKDGRELRAAVVIVKKDTVVLLNMRTLPTIAVTQAGGDHVVEANVGTLVLQTIPLECAVEIPALSIVPDHPEAKKIADQWTAKDIPVGDYQLKVSAIDKSVTYGFSIEKDQTTRLLIDIVKGTVRDLGEEAKRPSTFLFVMHGVNAGRSDHVVDKRAWGVKILDGENVLWESNVPTKDVTPEEYLTFRGQADGIPVKTITLIATQYYENRRSDQTASVSGHAPDAKVKIDVPPNKIVAIAQRKSSGSAPGDRQFQGLEMKIFDREQEDEARKWCEQADSDRAARRLTDGGGN